VDAPLGVRSSSSSAIATDSALPRGMDAALREDDVGIVRADHEMRRHNSVEA
jgi:hypothetical protein